MESRSIDEKHYLTCSMMRCYDFLTFFVKAKSVVVKVFLGLDDTCGYYSRLEHGFASIGVKTELVIAYPSREYPRTRKCSPVGSIVEFLGRKRYKSKQKPLFYFFYTFLESLALLTLFIYEFVVCDVFMFSGGVSFLRGLDLPLYKLFKKKVIIVFHGSDSRPPYLNGAYTHGDSRLTPQKLKRLSSKIFKHVRYCEKNATYIIQLPYTGHFHSKQFINFLAIGIPTIITEKNRAMRERTVLKVLHAPTRPLQKGTPIICKAIDRLKSEGYNIELNLITNKKPVEVFDAIENCDFVIDELYSDTPLAGFGSEAMAHGKTVVVGIHEPKALLETIPVDMIPPSILCCESSLYDCLKYILDDKDVLESYSEKGREFLKYQWSAMDVAKRYEALISGKFPESWIYKPNNLRYISGWGMSRLEVEKSLVLFAQKYGLNKMLLNDKPEILTRIQKIVGE